MLDWLKGRPPEAAVTYVDEATWVERASVGKAPAVPVALTRRRA
jgi:hypothetical protein